uniref:histidine kinase n=1 Tax=Geobacter metallireducens TaxID=28232 RepID=A0A831TZK1_GEOME
MPQTGPTCTCRTETERIAELERILADLQAELTERRNAERDLRHAKAAAEAMCLAKTELLAQVSHEMRCQLQMLTGAVELLRETPLDQNQTNYLNAFHHAGEFLHSLADDLLDNSRMEAGRFQLEQTEFHFDEFMAATAQLIAWQANRKGLQFECRLSPDLPTRLVGDPKRLKQIILNLAGNAVKFTSDGKITLAVELESPPPGDSARDTVLRFTIQDTGVGIPGDKLDEIFERYTQASPATARIFGGTGLGLAIARGLVGMMGGTIRVTSREGAGTCFVFSARFAPRAVSSPEAGERRKPPVAPLRSLRILLAEDAADIRMLMGAFLGNTPHSVDMACNGQEALAKYMAGNYDLVLMDMQMPVMDGISATLRIREWERSHGRPPVPVIALTAGAERSERLKSRAAGCTAHLAKPLRKETLLRTISDVMQQQPDHAQTSAQTGQGGDRP